MGLLLDANFVLKAGPLSQWVREKWEINSYDPDPPEHTRNNFTNRNED